MNSKSSFVTNEATEKNKTPIYSSLLQSHMVRNTCIQILVEQSTITSAISTFEGSGGLTENTDVTDAHWVEGRTNC